MIDSASLYFRVRALKIDVYDDFDLEWDKEIIYSGRSLEHFAGEPIAMTTMWRVDIIDLARDEVVIELSSIDSRDEAEGLLGGVRTDLESLSRLEFISKYFSED